jgi:hypothetical protein
VVAVPIDTNRADIGIVTASANFFRSLGGSIGAAVFGAVFAGALVGGVAHAVDVVFLVALPVALLALVTVLFLRGMQ